MTKSKIMMWTPNGEVHNHKCNNCNKYTNGLDYVYWEKKNFTLCMICAAELAKKFRVHIY